MLITIYYVIISKGSKDMQEINRNNSGNFEYSKPKILKSSKKSFTEALLGKIVHKTSNKLDFTLKLGRYKYPKQPDNFVPKSELTLDNEEFTNLINYIEENYEPLKLGQGKYLHITNTETLPILKQIQKLNIPNDKKAFELIESGILTDELQIVIDTIKRIDYLICFTALFLPLRSDLSL